MLKLQTPVTDQECKVGISYQDRILMIGSCFSENIGRQLADFGFDVCINPFGTLYNPISILRSIELLAGDRLFGTDDCIQIGAGDERWCSFSHHTSFARDTREQFLADANTQLASAREFFFPAAFNAPSSMKQLTKRECSAVKRNLRKRFLSAAERVSSGKFLSFASSLRKVS